MQKADEQILIDIIQEVGFDPHQFITPESFSPNDPNIIITLRYLDTPLIFEITETTEKRDNDVDFKRAWTDSKKGFTKHSPNEFVQFGDVCKSLRDWLTKQVIPYIKEQEKPSPFEAFTNPDDTSHDPVNFTHLTREQKHEHPTPEQREKMLALLQSVKDKVQQLRAAGVPADNPLLQAINANLERLETIQDQDTEAEAENTSNAWTSFQWCSFLVACLATLVQLASMFVDTADIDINQFRFNIVQEILEIFPHFGPPDDNLLPDAQ